MVEGSDQKMILDVGCGSNPSGDVNCDLKRGRVNIICDAEHLPFKDKAFVTVYSSHCLEHIQQPLAALREFQRVATFIVLKVPNADYNRNGWCEDQGHLYTWNSRSLTNLLSYVFRKVSVTPHVDSFNMKALLLSFILRKKHELTAVCQ